MTTKQANEIQPHDRVVLNDPAAIFMGRGGDVMVVESVSTNAGWTTLVFTSGEKFTPRALSALTVIEEI